MTDPAGNANIELADITRMIDILRESGWREARLKWGDFELHLSDGALAVPAAGVAAAPATAPAKPQATPARLAQAPVSTSEIADSSRHAVVRAKSLGVFWRSPQPGAPAFVEVGDAVDEHTPLAIIEVMKMMTRVEPGTRGTITAIHVENAAVVEFDQPLFTIAAG